MEVERYLKFVFLYNPVRRSYSRQIIWRCYWKRSTSLGLRPEGKNNKTEGISHRTLRRSESDIVPLWQHFPHYCNLWLSVALYMSVNVLQYVHDFLYIPRDNEARLWHNHTVPFVLTTKRMTRWQAPTKVSVITVIRRQKSVNYYSDFTRCFNSRMFFIYRYIFLHPSTIISCCINT
jgi:hypothetical protein